MLDRQLNDVASVRPTLRFLSKGSKRVLQGFPSDYNGTATLRQDECAGFGLRFRAPAMYSVCREFGTIV